MAIESKNHRPSHVDHVRVSQGTRHDAQPASGMRFETYRDEYDHWVAESKKLDAELVGYSKAAFAGEQARIRRRYSHDNDKSFNAWISKKASMEEMRQKLVKRKKEVEGELVRLKRLVKQESVRVSRERKRTGPGCLEGYDLFYEDGNLSRDAVAAEILLELRAIRTLLEANHDS